VAFAWCFITVRTLTKRTCSEPDEPGNLTGS